MNKNAIYSYKEKRQMRTTKSKHMKFEVLEQTVGMGWATAPYLSNNNTMKVLCLDPTNSKHNDT